MTLVCTVSAGNFDHEPRRDLDEVALADAVGCQVKDLSTGTHQVVTGLTFAYAGCADAPLIYHATNAPGSNGALHLGRS